MIYKSYGFTDSKRSATTILSRIAGSQSNVSESELEGAFDSMIKARQRAYSNMIKWVEGASKLGAARNDIIRSLESAKVSREDIGHILSGRTPEWRMSYQFIQSATNRAITSAPSLKRKIDIRKEMTERKHFIIKLMKENQ